MVLSRRISAVLLVLATLPVSGCLFHTRKVARNYDPNALKTATKPELIAYINR